MKWQKLDAKQRRNALILAAIVAAMLVALMWPSGTMRLRRVPHPSPFPVAARPGGNPGRAVAQAPAAVPPAISQDAGMLGKWVSAPAELQKRGLCTLWTEVARKPATGDAYTAAATLSCISTFPSEGSKLTVAPQNAVLADMTPLSATMSGAWRKDGIAFHMDKVLNDRGCPFTEFSVSKFGSQFLTAEFQDECGGGSMLLHPAR